jgi:hypothetical protein
MFIEERRLKGTRQSKMDKYVRQNSMASKEHYIHRKHFLKDFESTIKNMNSENKESARLLK